MGANNEQILDVAVVGGGVSGLYTAWRLVADQASTPGARPPQVAVFEGSARLGGRLLSMTPPGMSTLVAEFGGANYFTSHTLVRSLVENRLNLPHAPIAVAGGSLEALQNNLAYLRGQRLHLKDLTDPAKLPYHLENHEQGQSPDALMQFAALQLLPALKGLTGEALLTYLQTANVDGRLLADWGLWNLMKRALSQEAYAFARDGGGYDFLLLNYNAADMIRMAFDLAPGVSFRRVVTGYEQLPLTLAAQFEAAGGQVYLQHRLKAFTQAQLPDGTPGVALALRAESDGWGPLAGGRPVTVYARRLVLALPRRALELLDQVGPLFAPEDLALGRHIRNLLAAVTPMPFLKLNLCYPGPWWEALGITTGRAVTDLPMRQCYYFGADGDQPGAPDKANRNALLLASFDDSSNVAFWAGLRHPHALPPFAAGPNPRRAAHPGAPQWSDFRLNTTHDLVKEVQRQLREVHGLRYIPDPYDAALVDWGDDPYGGAAHSWNIHARSWDLIPQIVKPAPGVPVYVCGEAYSARQGYVEGALETAEWMLEQHFNLKPPTWVTPDPTG